MEILFIIMSFFIHFIVLIAIGLLYKQVKDKSENSAEVMQLLETYLQEVKAENERLQKEILRSSPQQKLTPFNNYPEPQATSKVSKAKVETNRNGKKANDYRSPENDEKVDYDLSLQSQILQLHDRGYAKEDIARKLNCGKTEVELFIKLYNKKTT